MYLNFGTVLREATGREHEVIVLDEVDSTNEEVKRRAAAGAREGLVVLSERQSAGKGRMGRRFYSPDGSGIYMSLLLRPRDIAATDMLLVTTQAAVAVAHGVSETCHVETQIKWVNDVYYNDKKICGILTEAIADPVSGTLDAIVVGIGINVCKPVILPEELQDVMGFIYDNNSEKIVSRSVIAAAIIKQLLLYYEALPERVFLEEYRSRSNVIGRRIRFGTPGEVAGRPGPDWRSGRALAIDDTGGLVVQLDDGSEEVLHTGEISLRISEK